VLRLAGMIRQLGCCFNQRGLVRCALGESAEFLERLGVDELCAFRPGGEHLVEGRKELVVAEGGGTSRRVRRWRRAGRWRAAGPDSSRASLRVPGRPPFLVLGFAHHVWELLRGRPAPDGQPVSLRSIKMHQGHCLQNRAR
jgi:hypothetical protein